MPMKRIVAPIMLIVLGGMLLIQLPLAIADRSTSYEWFDPIIDVRTILLEDYVLDPDAQAMQEATIRGLLDSLDDPYTVYVPPAQERNFNKELRGQYVGIGAEVRIVDDMLTIVTPLDDSPSLEAGVRAGDIFLAIEDVETAGRPIDESIELLLGEPDTPVRVRVRHLDGSDEELVITRRHIVTPTVKGVQRDGRAWRYCVDPETRVMYVRISQFNDSTAADLRKLLEQLQAQGMQGLVLDLRDNPGGALDSALRVSNLFLDGGLIVTVRDRDGNGPSYNADDQGTLPDFPMVVLANGQSASASEIVSGALQASGRAHVLGTRTYGKGSVQEVRELEYDRGTLKYTAAHYHLSNGRNIHRHPGNAEWGVDPSPGMVIPMDEQEQVDRIEARREHEIIRDNNSTAPECVGIDWIVDVLRDEQLARAVEAIDARLAGKPWPEFSDLDSQITAIEQQLQEESLRRAYLLDQVDRTEDRIAQLQDMEQEAGTDDDWPEQSSLAGGTITLRSSEGQIIGTYRIEGGNVALALETLELERVEEEE